MLRKSFMVCSIAAAFFLHAQDASTITNTLNVYSNSSMLGSARYNAMAGSTGALGGDATSMMNNPAGLGVAISPSASGTLLIDNYKNKSTLNGRSVDYDKSTVDGNFNAMTTFQLMTETPWKFVNIGVNYTNQNLDNYVESPGNSNIKFQKNLLDNNSNAVTGNLSYLGHAYNRTGSLSKMSLGVGANYDNRIYLGAGLNLHGSDIQQFDTASFGLDLDKTVSNYDKQYTPFNETGTGVSANIGIIGKVNNKIRLGLAVESPTFWDIERVYTEYYTNNSGLISNDAFTEKRSLSTPLKTIFSASLVPNKNFSINVDYTLGITKTRFTNNGPAEEELNDFFRSSSKNMSDIRAGAEYRIKALRLRAGYGYASSPLDDISFSAYDAAGNAGTGSSKNLFIGSRNTVGLGLGYDWRSFSLDAAYQNIHSKYVNPFLAGNSDFGTGYYSQDFDVSSNASAVSDVEQNRNNFSLTLGWKF